MKYCEDFREICDLLLEYDANINQVDGDEETILMMTVQNPKMIEATRYLLSQYIDINKQNKYGDTALHIAAQVPENEECITLLVEYGARIDAKNEKSQTPLEAATLDQKHKASVEKAISIGMKNLFIYILSISFDLSCVYVFYMYVLYTQDHRPRAYIIC